MKEDITYKKNLALEYLLEHPYAFIAEISRATGISKSSVQRYLESFSDVIIPETNQTVKDQLRINKLRGQRKGGITSFENNDQVKDESGKFIGSIKAQSQDKELQKQKDILFISTYYLSKGQISLQDLASELSEIGIYTKDYVYDCLTDQRLSGLIGETSAMEITRRLRDARPTNIDKEQSKLSR